MRKLHVLMKKEELDGQRLDGKVVIVTGAGSGIGQATVARLLDEGGNLGVVAPVDRWEIGG